MTLGPGARLGPYELTALLGEGGMGKVWRAHHTALRRDDALKVLPDAFASDPERLARFRREAQVLASLNHPNIARVYGLEQSGDVQALVMELVDGPTLADRIAQGPIPVDEALPIAKQIAEALEAAHEQGIIHRDLKPANIKVRPDGTVKVLDFGLAKALEPAGAMPDTSQSPTITTPAMMTGLGVLLGTAAYMSPEQARGKAVDKRSDIWAFGCVLYEILTNQQAFPGDDVTETIAAVIRDEPDWSRLPAGMSEDLQVVLRSCLQKDPKQRIGDMQSLRLMLADNLRIPVRAEGGRSRTNSARRRALLAVATFAVGAVGAAGLWIRQEAPPARVVRAAIDAAGPAALNVQIQDRNLAVTPDSSRLVFRGQDDLYVRRLDETQPMRLTMNAPGARMPFVSPDGQWVGFFQGDLLRKVAITGGSPVTIATFAMGVGPRGATWGADGTIIYAAEDGLGLRQVSAAGGMPRTLTTVDAKAGEAAHLWPELIPDRNAVLFTVLMRDSGLEAAQIDVLDLDTDTRATILHGGTHGQYARDGLLIFSAGEILRAVPFDVQRLATTGTPAPVAERVRISPTGGIDAVVSSDGTLVYVPPLADTGANQVLAIVSHDGSKTPLNARPGRYRSPSLSPDGKQVAVESVDAAGKSSIWIYDMSGKAAIRLLGGPGNNMRPLWTRDSRRITFSSDRDGPASLYWQLADGSAGAERLTTAEERTEHWPDSWSPDGRTLIYTIRNRGGAEGAIWTLSLDPPEAPVVFDDAPRSQNAGAVSPDGRWLAYTTTEAAYVVAGGADIFVQPFPKGGAKYAITRGTERMGGAIPHWSPDGKTLFYRRPVVGDQVFAVDIRTESGFTFSNERALNVRGFSAVQFFRDYDLTRDGRFLMLFSADEIDESNNAAPPRIHFVLNWLDELKRLMPTN